MEFKCKKCGHSEYRLEAKGTQTGLYCAKCGFWHKWVAKDELYRNEWKAIKPIFDLPDTLVINGVKYKKVEEDKPNA